MTQWTESLWGDEGFSAMAVQRPFGQMLSIVMRDTAPPLFYLVGYLWGKVFGYSEVALRSLTLLLTLGSSIFAGLIVWHISRQRIPAVLTTLLALFSPFLFSFAFEWRMYALLTFTITASVYFFVTRRWGWYVIFALAAIYTHHFALFTVAAQGLWFMLTEFAWTKPKTWLKQLRPFILIGLLYLPWLYPMYLQTQRVKGGGFWLSTPTLKQAGNMLLQFVTGGVPEKFRGLVALSAGWLLVFKDWRRVGQQWLMLFVVILAPMALAFGVSHLITPVFYDRYLLSVGVGMAILIGLGTPRKLWPLLVGLLFLYSYFSWYQFTHPTKRPFKQLATYVKSEQRSGDYLVNYNGRAHHLWESKYYGIPAPIYVPGVPLPFYVGTAQMTPQDTISSLPARISGRLGVISSEPVEQISLPGYRLSEVQRFGELFFSWWQ